MNRSFPQSFHANAAATHLTSRHFAFDIDVNATVDDENRRDCNHYDHAPRHHCDNDDGDGDVVVTVVRRGDSRVEGVGYWSGGVGDGGNGSDGDNAVIHVCDDDDDDDDDDDNDDDGRHGDYGSDRKGGRDGYCDSDSDNDGVVDDSGEEEDAAQPFSMLSVQVGGDGESRRSRDLVGYGNAKGDEDEENYSDNDLDDDDDDDDDEDDDDDICRAEKTDWSLLGVSEGDVLGPSPNSNPNPNSDSDSNSTSDTDSETVDRDEALRRLRSATWSEVVQSCFFCFFSSQRKKRTTSDWACALLGPLALLSLLYFFLLGLELMANSARVLSGCAAASAFGGAGGAGDAGDADAGKEEQWNPMAAFMLGVMATALLQSSSTTTSVVVGLAGTGTMRLQSAIYVIMGANVGTTLTNTVVAMAMTGRRGDRGCTLERAFAGATVHDAFNYLSAAILLPLEVSTGYLFRLTGAIVAGMGKAGGGTSMGMNERGGGGDGGDGEWIGPIRKVISPVAEAIMRPAGEGLIRSVAVGTSTCDDGRYYPVRCRGGILDYWHCRPCRADEPIQECDPSEQGSGLIGCSSLTGRCPAFFAIGADQTDDRVSAGVCLFLSILLLVACLVALVSLLQSMLLGMSTRIIYKATDVNGYVAILIGCGVTILVQSSSVTTSTLTPLVGMGILSVDQMYPLTIGANVGTTCTALVAASVGDSVESLRAALAHLFFNLSGIVIWYPLPPMRRVPVGIARKLGAAARVWRAFPVLYLLMAFFVIPLLVLALLSCFRRGSLGYTVLGSFFSLVLGVSLLAFAFWWNCVDGKRKCIDCARERQRRRDAMDSLETNMAVLMEEIRVLREHTGLLAGEAEDDKDAHDCSLDDSDNGGKGREEEKKQEEEEEVKTVEVTRSDESWGSNWEKRDSYSRVECITMERSKTKGDNKK